MDPQQLLQTLLPDIVGSTSVFAVAESGENGLAPAKPIGRSQKRAVPNSDTAPEKKYDGDPVSRSFDGDFPRGSAMGQVVSIDSLRAVRGKLLSLDEQRSIRVSNDGPNPVYFVPSDTSKGVIYDVFADDDGKWRCTPCPDFAKRQKPCKHIAEVFHRFHPEMVPPVTEAELDRFRIAKQMYAGARRLPHQPHVYKSGLSEARRMDKALEIQHARILTLVHDIAVEMNGSHSYERRRGPREMPPGDMAAAAIIRADRGDSHRKACSTNSTLREMGILSTKRGRTTMTKLYSSTSMKSALEEATRLALMPFQVVETAVIIDSTGFSPQFVSNHLNMKHLKIPGRVGTEWLIIHVMIGMISKAIIGFTVTASHGDDSHDTTQVVPLLKMLKPLGFDRVRHVVADNMYLTVNCQDAAKSLGYKLIGPSRPRNFDKSHELKPKFVEMMTAGQEDAEWFDELVRKRNSIEGIFSVLKRQDNHIAAVGNAFERLQKSNGGCYLSRENELRARVLAQVLHRTITWEVLQDKVVSYADKTMFRVLRDDAAQSA